MSKENKSRFSEKMINQIGELSKEEQLNKWRSVHLDYFQEAAVQKQFAVAALTKIGFDGSDKDTEIQYETVRLFLELAENYEKDSREAYRRMRALEEEIKDNE